MLRALITINSVFFMRVILMCQYCLIVNQQNIFFLILHMPTNITKIADCLRSHRSFYVFYDCKKIDILYTLVLYYYKIK